jgi:hypothetical protein
MKKYYCPACDFKKSEELFASLNVCDRCNHIFKNKRMEKKFYKDYISSAHNAFKPLDIKRLEYITKYRINLVNAFCNSGKLLEIGCGNKYFLEKSSEQFEVEGVEVSEPLFKALSKKYEMHFGTPSELKDLDKYDAICGWNVFHLFNEPLLELRTMSLHLNENGYIFLEFPMLSFIGLDVDPTKFYKGEQTQYFNQTSLNIIAELSGLKIIYQTNYWESEHVSMTMVCLAKDNRNPETLKGKFTTHLAYGETLDEFIKGGN